MGAKRKRIESSDEEDFSDASEFIDASGSTTKSNPTSSKKRGRPTRDDDDKDETDCVQLNNTHSVSRHCLERANELQKALLEWFDGVHDKRAMPWRKRYDATLGPDERAQRAYEVWVSEIMLQQTQVATVIPYYNRWMAKFPTLASLAASDSDTVAAVWKGLGYYSRGSRLLSGAQKVMEEFEGKLPSDPKVLEKGVPGIGRYSAGAICSIAYGVEAPVLDGNVHRVMSRLLALHGNPKAKRTLDLLWQGATDMVQGCSIPGALNQGLIELGSTVCKPKDPSCGECPLKSGCAAYAQSQRNSDPVDIEDLCTICEPYPATTRSVTRYPMKAAKKKARQETDLVCVIEWRRGSSSAGHPPSHFLLEKRPEEGLLAGLWEFPTMDNVTFNASATQAEAEALLTTLLVPVLPPFSRASSFFTKQRTGGSALHIKKMLPGKDITHLFSHIRKTFRVLWLSLEGGDEPPTLQLQTEGKTSKKQKVYNVKLPQTEREPTRKWVLECDVENQNIGTGTVKVWKEVLKLKGGTSKVK